MEVLAQFLFDPHVAASTPFPQIAHTRVQGPQVGQVMREGQGGGAAGSMLAVLMVCLAEVSTSSPRWLFTPVSVPGDLGTPPVFPLRFTHAGPWITADQMPQPTGNTHSFQGQMLGVEAIPCAANFSQCRCGSSSSVVLSSDFPSRALVLCALHQHVGTAQCPVLGQSSFPFAKARGWLSTPSLSRKGSSLY